MKKNKRLLHTLGNIPEKYIYEAISEKARKMKTQWKYIITAAACFVVIAAVPVYIMKKSPNQNGSNNNGDITVTEVSEVTSESQTSVSTAQTEQTESTPQKEMIFAGTGPEKASDYKPDSMNSSAGNFDFKDGYFVVSFLKDKEFEERINADIREATDSLQPYFDEKYLENAHLSADANSWENLDNTHGLTIYPNCCNGYLSIVIGYAYEMNDEYGIPINKSYDHAVTLNYDLFEQKKIEKFSDLFYNGEDILSLINEELIYTVNSSSLFRNVQKKKFDGLTELPELFTIRDIIFDTDNPYLNVAPAIRYTPYFNPKIYDHMITGKYRDMKNIIDDNLCECYDIDYYEWDIKINEVKEDNITVYYEQITGSRLHTQEEINEYQNMNDKLQHIAVKYYMDNYAPEDLPDIFFKSDTGYDIYACNFDINLNIFFSNVYTTNVNQHSINIDTNTYKILSLSEVLKKDFNPDDWSGTMETDNGESRNVDINSYTHLKEWDICPDFSHDSSSAEFKLGFNVDNTYMHGILKSDGLNRNFNIKY